MRILPWLRGDRYGKKTNLGRIIYGSPRGRSKPGLLYGSIPAPTSSRCCLMPGTGGVDCARHTILTAVRPLPRWIGVQDLEAIDQLLNHTSKTLSADFNTGVAWDVQALVQQTQHFDGGNWLIRWILHDGVTYERLVLDQTYRGRVAEVFEIQTDDGHPVPNPEST